MWPKGQLKINLIYLIENFKTTKKTSFSWNSVKLRDIKAKLMTDSKSAHKIIYKSLGLKRRKLLPEICGLQSAINILLELHYVFNIN